MVGGEEDESSEGDGMIYFFFLLLSFVRKGREGNCGTKLGCVWKEPCI